MILGRMRLAAAMLGMAVDLLVPAQLSAVSYFDKRVTISFVDTRPCTFFQLEGVTQADPIAPNSPWFALDTTVSTFQQMNAILLTAKVSGLHLNVDTSGQLACGYAKVSLIGNP